MIFRASLSMAIKIFMAASRIAWSRAVSPVARPSQGPFSSNLPNVSFALHTVFEPSAYSSPSISSLCRSANQPWIWLAIANGLMEKGPKDTAVLD